jgi:hypothetical protein
MRKSAGRKDGGFVLVWALLLMVILLILGVSGIGTSIFESMMTANDALHKQSFFQADGGANTAAMLIEENINCPGGFSVGLIPPINSTVSVGTLSLYKNSPPTLPLLPTPPSNANRDAFYFYNAADPGGTSTTLPRTNIKTYGTPKVLPGGPMEMAAGYEGKGKGLPGGGATIDYDTFSQHLNVRQSQSIVRIMWQHLIGFEGTCKY